MQAGQQILVIEANSATPGEIDDERPHAAHVERLLGLRGVLRGQTFEVHDVVRTPPRPPAEFRRLGILDVLDEEGLSTAIQMLMPMLESGRPALRDHRVRAYRAITARVQTSREVPAGSTEQHIYFVQTDPVGNREDEYNEWYTERHLADVLDVPGFVAAQRYMIAGRYPDSREPQGRRYMAIYEIQGDAQRAIDSLGAVRRSGQMHISPAMNPDTRADVYTPVGDLVLEDAERVNRAARPPRERQRRDGK
jgi:hypothetical protein